MTHITIKVIVVLVTVLCVSPINGANSEEHDGSCSPYDKFKEAFYDGLASSSDTFQQYNIAMRPELAYDVFYKASIKFYTGLNHPNAKEIADTRASASVYRAECVTAEKLSNVNSNAIEEILEKTGVITDENAVYLARKYLKYLQHARKLHGYDGSPQANLQSVFDAGLHFIKDTVPYTPNTAEVVSDAFKNNFKTLDCCCAKKDH